MRFQTLLFALLGFGYLPCSADILWQRSGRSLEAIVLEETDNTVTFTLGIGRVTIPRSQLDRIEYSSAEKKQQILSEWESLYFYDDQYVPEKFSPLAEIFRNLRASHGAMKQAVRERAARKVSAAKASTRMPRCVQEMTRLRAQCAQLEAPLREDRLRLNKLTGEMSRLASLYTRSENSNAQRNELHKAYDELRKQRDPLFLHVENATAEYRAISSRLDSVRVEYQELAHTRDVSIENQAGQPELGQFMNLLESFHDELRRCEALELSASSGPVLKRFSAAAAALAVDVRQDQVAISRRGETLQTMVVVNGFRSAVMIVDTGASHTTISRRFAESLNLGPFDNFPRKSLQLADGRTVSAAEVRLQSVQVGTTIRNDVPALVLDDPPSPGVDGLLGMSFLKNYVIRLDANQHDLKLISFEE